MQCTECFILCIARARPCFNCFKELTHERLVEGPFQVLPIRQLCRLGLDNSGRYPTQMLQ